jgi:cobalt/nickel transport system permease protein
LHHVVLELWSRGDSPLHRRDARAKIIALLFFLVLIATSRGTFLLPAATYFLILIAALIWARLPLWGALARSCLVLPFSLLFAGITLAAGDPPRAASLVTKSYLSALSVLLVISTTPMAQLLRGLEALGLPRFLLMVAQFLYRYLFVISEEAQHMRAAGIARGASIRGFVARGARFRSAAGALAVLFARSYAHAGSIHQAMLARGFQGRFHLLNPNGFRWPDAVFLLGACSLPLAIKIGLERVIR